MQKLKAHFNAQARRARKRRETQVKRDLDFFTLWMILLLLVELERQWQRRLSNMTRPPSFD